MKYLKFLTLILVVSSLFTSCRKGPEDPLLSFTTRKNRISKDWKAYAYRVDGIDLITESKNEKFETASCGQQTLITNLERSIIMRFSKSGSYSESKTVTGVISSTITNTTEMCSVYNFTNNVNETEGKSGVWSFSGGTNGTSNREQVFIYQEETKIGELWDIVKLATDELKLKRNYIRPGASVFTTEEIFLRPL